MLLAFAVYLSLMLGMAGLWALVRHETTAGVAVRSTGVGSVLVVALTVLAYGLVLGLRENVGGDYHGYVHYFNALTPRMDAGDVPYEWGFYVLLRTLRSFDLAPVSLFLVTCAAQMFFISWWLRRHTFLAPWYVYFLFTSLFVFESMNTVRQAVACACVLAAMPLLLERRLVAYVTMVGVASLFHGSALLFIPLYFVLDRDWILSPRWQIAALLTMYAVADLLKDFLFELLPLLAIGLSYEGYSEVTDALFFEGEVKGLSAGMLFLLTVDSFIMLSSPMMRRRFGAHGFRVYYNLYLIGALFTPIVLYANYIPFQRIGFYFTAFKPVILAFLMVAWFSEGEGRQRPLMKLTAAAIIMAYLFWFLLAILNKAAACAPFRFISL